MRVVKSTAFSFHPTPFGSVFLLEAGSTEFGLADVPLRYRAFGTALPSRRLLIVLFADRGVVRKCIQKFPSYRELLEEVPAEVPPQLHLAARMFWLLRLQNHLRIPAAVRCLPTAVVSVPI